MPSKSSLTAMKPKATKSRVNRNWNENPHFEFEFYLEWRLGACSNTAKAAKHHCEQLGSALRYAEARLEAHGSRRSGTRGLRGCTEERKGLGLSAGGAEGLGKAREGLGEVRRLTRRLESAEEATRLATRCEEITSELGTGRTKAPAMRG